MFDIVTGLIAAWMELQWGRDHLIAEMSAERRSAVIAGRRFNGAAII